MHRVIEWARWEFDRPIEVTNVIKFITIERFLKAAVLIAGGIVLLVVSAKTDLHRYAQDLQEQLNLTPGRSWMRQMYEKIVVHFGTLSHRTQDLIAVGAILYGALEALEGIGLLLRRRWAEYLVLIATAVFLPLEVNELIHKVTPTKAGALLINVLIIVYLIWRKRLFLDRPGHPFADETEPIPPDLSKGAKPAK